jgi:hypothetical protein
VFAEKPFRIFLLQRIGNALCEGQKKKKQTNKSQFIYIHFFFDLVMHPVFTGNKHNLHAIFLYTTTASDCSTWKRFLGYKKYTYIVRIIYINIYKYACVCAQVHRRTHTPTHNDILKRVEKNGVCVCFFWAFPTAVPAKRLL